MACNVTRRILDAVNPRHLNSHNDDHGKQTQQGRLRFEKVWNSEIPEVADHYNCLRPIDMAWHLIYSSRRGLWTRSTSRKAIKYSCKHSSLWNVHSIKTTASLLFWVSCLVELHEFKKNTSYDLQSSRGPSLYRQLVNRQDNWRSPDVVLACNLFYP